MCCACKTGNINASLESIKKSGITLNASEPFDFSFFDKDFQKNYDAENQLSAIVGIFYRYCHSYFMFGFIWFANI